MKELIVSLGAATLLTIAKENDKNDLLENNICLKECLSFLKELPEKCNSCRLQELYLWLGIEKIPSSFLGLCALILNSIDLKVQSSFSGKKWSNATDYDHGILLGLGQTLAEAASLEENKHPSIEEAIERYKTISAVDFQKSLIGNYLGNLLQDYFDACNVRIKNPSLPSDTEENLRYSDAYNIAEYLFENITKDGQINDIFIIQNKLRDIIKEISENG